jgi:hypothetical protein
MNCFRLLFVLVTVLPAVPLPVVVAGWWGRTAWLASTAIQRGGGASRVTVM